MKKPPYFEEIRNNSSRRWDQLEADRELAGPWRQLFKQVQSPRHVVSELLQNADDAGATWASVKIVNGEFIFTHNGEDFTQEHFGSLCRFGYSNKRALHTIGFRGIGFKSTFSLGDEVRLYTPTLSVCFRNTRFTEPVWTKQLSDISSEMTQIRVKIKDKHRLQDLEKNLYEWLTNSTSLLFFRNIRSLEIKSEEVHWKQTGKGPIANSGWMILASQPDEHYLLIRSEAEKFPPEAIEEINQERDLDANEQMELPPCHVEIVLGLPGRLFVVLPTSIKADLPFAINAPFVQDPARVKIKDPETSPTNRWLLDRAGKLAAKAMLAWLENEKLSIPNRCKAYRLIPSPKTRGNSLEVSCGQMVQESFKKFLENKKFLLTETGSLGPWDSCTAVPEILLDVWNEKQVNSHFVSDSPEILSRHVSEDNLQKLEELDCIYELTKKDVNNTIEKSHLPQPQTWGQLLELWVYLSESIITSWPRDCRRGLKIFPVQGKNVLYEADELVRLGDKKLLNSEEDWKFLHKYLIVLNGDWPAFLEKQNKKAKDDKDENLEDDIKTAKKMLEILNLDHASGPSRIIEKVADAFFQQEDCELKDCVRIAQLAAAFNAELSDTFEFVTQDVVRKKASNTVIFDEHQDMDTFMSQKWCQEHVLHDDYGKFISCTKEVWQKWAQSEKSKLLGFAPLIQIEIHQWYQKILYKFLDERGFVGTPSFSYKSESFTIEDWNFDEEIWAVWELLANDDKELWCRILKRILDQPSEYWPKELSATVRQNGTKYSALVTRDFLLPAWAAKFRALPCLKDTKGKCRQPAELMRRTPETEYLMDVEPFISAELDTEKNRPLLKLLGVRDTPTGPEKIIERIRALAKTTNPPIRHLAIWYGHLEKLTDRLSAKEMEDLKAVFANESLILTSEKGWAKLSEVFINGDEAQFPGVAIIDPSVSHLSLWKRIGVEEKPDADIILKWLKELKPGNERLPDSTMKQVKLLLGKYPQRIWGECVCWLNLLGEWTPVENLKYSISMQTLVPWKHLFDPFKRQTADFQKLSFEDCRQAPFASLPSLAASITERFDNRPSGREKEKPWLKALGEGISRIELDDSQQTGRVQEIGRRLATTRWFLTDQEIEAVPYINGQPAGTPRKMDVAWVENDLFVPDKPMALIIVPIVAEIGRPFDRQDILDAVKLCFERGPDFVEDYLESAFNLAPQTDPAPQDQDMDQNPEPEKPTDRPDEPEPDADDGSDSEDRPNDEGMESPHEDKPTKIEVGSHDEQEDLPPNPDDQIDTAPKPTKAKKPEHPPLPSLMELFAKSLGYIKDGADRFYHEDGSSIVKVKDSAFPWERRSKQAELISRYFVVNKCLENETIELEAAIWNLCINGNNQYSLILKKPDGFPLDYTGNELLELRDIGLIEVLAASYRIRIKDSNQLEEQ